MDMIKEQQHTAHEWWVSANIYEVNLRQYTEEGTIAAFMHHLPRLKDMGVKILWLMPIQPIGELKRKGTVGSYYSISDYQSVNPEFGTIDDFKTLVEAVHAMEMKLVIDWVANHSAWDNSWMQDHKDYYTQNEQGDVVAPFDWDDVADLNYNNPELHTAMRTAMAFWVEECNIDGFRCDMAHLVPLDFWKETRKELDAIKPLFWLAETQDEPYFEAFDVVYGWEWLHKLEDYAKHKTSREGLQSVVQHYCHAFSNNKFRILFTSNHDENSHSGTEYERMGNAAESYAVLCCTLPGMPLLYSGQEEPLKDKRILFFEKDLIPFEHYALHDFYKTLFNLRSQNPALHADREAQYMPLTTNDTNEVFAFLRVNGNRKVLVLVNLSSEATIRFSVEHELLQGNFRHIFNGNEYPFNGGQLFELAPLEYVVYEQ
jgi:glycosidase